MRRLGGPHRNEYRLVRGWTAAYRIGRHIRYSGEAFSAEGPSLTRVMRPPSDVAVQSDVSAPARILVVDDEPAVRAAMARSLALHGYEVTCAVSGEEAIRAIDDAESRFDLVITDVVMDGMSGVALAEELRARDESLPVILVTGYPGSHLTDPIVTTTRLLDVLQKPFTPTQLAAHAQRSISQSHRE